MSWIPRATNPAYRGSPFAWWVLLLLGVLNLVRGGIHLLASDGGAGRIAGIDLSRDRETIVFLFAVIGVQQLTSGVLDLVVALRYRSFAPLLLFLGTLKQVVVVVVAWFYKPLPVQAPGKYGAVAALPLMLLAFVLSLRTRGEAGLGASTTASG